MAAFNSVAVVLGPVGVVLGIAGKQAQPSTLQESSYVVDHRAPLVSAALALAAAGCGADSSATASPNSPGQKPRRTASDRSSSSTVQRVTRHATTVSMTEFRFGPKALSVRPGKVRITAKN